MSGLPILAFAPGNWNLSPDLRPSVAGSTRYYLWTLAERGWPIVYVEPPTRFRSKTTIWEAEDRPFRVLSPGWIPPFGVRGIPVAGAADLLRMATSAYLFSAARQHCEKTLFSPKVLWLGAPWHSSMIPTKTENLLIVHHNYDELADSPALKPFQSAALHRWEEELLRRSDLVLCSSVPQLKKRVELNPQAVLLENAVKDSFLHREDVDEDERKAFAPLVENLRALPQPRIVYGGVADHRLDGDLLNAVWEKFPQASFAFLGNKDQNLSPSAKAFFAHPNVHVFGKTPHDAYPFLYAEADALIYPMQQTLFTAGMFPDKLGEYLASGKPVVSVASHEVVRLAKESRDGVIRVASTPQEFCSKLSEAMNERDEVLPALRRGLASKRTHLNQTAKLEKLLWEGLTQKGVSGSPKAP